MILNEEQAKTKDCLVWTLIASVRRLDGGTYRGGSAGGGTSVCRGSECMHWQWVDSERRDLLKEQRKGRCGLCNGGGAQGWREER